MKYIKTILALTLLLCVLSGCAGTAGKKSIPVISTYPHLEKLVADEYTYDKIDTLEDGDDPYRRLSCVVSVFYDQLVVTDKLYYDNAISGVEHILHAGNYWGDETGVFRQDENGDNEIVTMEEFIAFIPSYSEEHLIAVTAGAYEGNLHFLDAEPTETDHPTLAFDGIPEAVSYHFTDKFSSPPDHFYIATDISLVRVDVGHYLESSGCDSGVVKTESFAVPIYWEYIDVNSMCELDGVLYMGSQMGVVAYDIEDDVYTYYPVDYETAIGEK
jgi:hypothetical protein